MGGAWDNAQQVPFQDPLVQRTPKRRLLAVALQVARGAYNGIRVTLGELGEAVNGFF